MELGHFTLVLYLTIVQQLNKRLFSLFSRFKEATLLVLAQVRRALDHFLFELHNTALFNY